MLILLFVAAIDWRLSDLSGFAARPSPVVARNPDEPFPSRPVAYPEPERIEVPPDRPVTVPVELPEPGPPVKKWYMLQGQGGVLGYGAKDSQGRVVVERRAYPVPRFVPTPTRNRFESPVFCPTGNCR